MLNLNEMEEIYIIAYRSATNEWDHTKLGREPSALVRYGTIFDT